MMHKLFFDKLFCSPEIVTYLHPQGIWAIGTLNVQRSRKCPIPSEKDLKKGGRGATAEIKSSNKPLVVTSWYDNKRVTLISNFVGKNNVDQCTRFDRKERSNIKVQRPTAVRIYNSFVGGLSVGCIPHKLSIKKMVPSYFFQSCQSMCGKCVDNSP